ncbi:MAG TPA: hypothetical protein PK170_11975, partial [Anaerolineae bacterium]|nr:hypothetical protein [Anaerolineae bacterium]
MVMQERNRVFPKKPGFWQTAARRWWCIDGDAREKPGFSEKTRFLAAVSADVYFMVKYHEDPVSHLGISPSS